MRRDPAIDQWESNDPERGLRARLAPARINFLPRLLLPADLANLFV